MNIASLLALAATLPGTELLGPFSTSDAPALPEAHPPANRAERRAHLREVPLTWRAHLKEKKLVKSGRLAEAHERRIANNPRRKEVR